MGQAIEKQQNPLGYEPVQKLLAQFALPAVISMLVSAVYNIVDQIFIGQGVGFLGNAATTVSFPIVTIMLSISTLLGAGGSAYAAIKLGEKREEEAERTLGNVFMLLLAAGVLLAAVGLIFLDPILHLFGATSQNLEYSRDYASIILIGAPFNMLSVGLSNMARTDGNPRLSMYSMVIGCALNTVLDPIYIFIFGWGVKGAAIATITSQILSAVVLTVYFLSRGKMRLRRANLRPAGHICKTVIALGVSSCITQLASTILQIAMNNSLVYYGNQSPVGGDIALSAMGIVVKVSAILIAVDIGIGIGSQPILGFNRGPTSRGALSRPIASPLQWPPSSQQRDGLSVSSRRSFCCACLALADSSLLISRSNVCVSLCSAFSAPVSRLLRPAIFRRPVSRSRRPRCRCCVN